HVGRGDAGSLPHRPRDRAARLRGRGEQQTPRVSCERWGRRAERAVSVSRGVLPEALNSTRVPTAWTIYVCTTTGRHPARTLEAPQLRRRRAGATVLRG